MKIEWPAWFRYTLTAALSVSVGAFGIGQVWESRSAQASQASQAAGEAGGKVDALTPRVVELEGWRREEVASRAALAKQLEQLIEANKAAILKADDLAKSVHRIEGALLKDPDK